MGGSTWDVLGIPGYYVLRDWGVYIEGCIGDVLGIPGYYVLRVFMGDVPAWDVRDSMY